MLDIYCPGFCHRVNGSLANMIGILRDDFIEADSFIQVRYEDGSEGVIQKGSITGVRECGLFCKEERELKIIEPDFKTTTAPVTINIACDSGKAMEDIQAALDKALKEAMRMY